MKVQHCESFFKRCVNNSSNFCFQSYPILDYWFFLRVAEKLGIYQECRRFTSSRNPTEAFLQLYSEREGSTVRALVGALRECQLTHFANEIEMKFASVQETEEFKGADIDESIV